MIKTVVRYAIGSRISYTTSSTKDQKGGKNEKRYYVSTSRWK